MLPLAAQSLSQGPQPTPMPPPVPAPQDRPCPGVIHLQVDATDLNHRIFAIHESIPVTGAGPMILLHPQWVPGHHAPNNPLVELGGLRFRANGKRLEWTRDPVNVFAFHITVPSGAASVDADFQWPTPVTTAVGRVTMTQEMLDLQWNAAALYPAGYFSRDVQIEPALTLPEGWQMGTALEPASTRRSRTDGRSRGQAGDRDVHVRRRRKGAERCRPVRLGDIPAHAPRDPRPRRSARWPAARWLSPGVQQRRRRRITSASEHQRHYTNFVFSIGVAVNRDGTLSQVQWDGPAFKAGLTNGMKIVGVDDASYSADVLKRAIVTAKGSDTPIRLTLQFGERVWGVSVDYHDGLRYPHLERIDGTPARLDDIFRGK